jgi:hypothetical protein
VRGQPYHRATRRRRAPRLCLLGKPRPGSQPRTQGVSRRAQHHHIAGKTGARTNGRGGERPPVHTTARPCERPPRGEIPTAAAPPAGTRLARPQCPRQAARTARSCLQLLADENRHARPTVRPRAPPKLLPALHDFWRDVTNPAHEPRKLDGVLVPSRPTPRALRRRPDTLSDAAGIVQLLSVHDKWSISIYTAEGDLWANSVDEHTPKCEWISCHRLLLGAALGTATPQASGLTVPLLSGTSWQPFLSSDHGEQ